MTLPSPTVILPCIAFLLTACSTPQPPSPLPMLRVSNDYTSVGHNGLATAYVYADRTTIELKTTGTPVQVGDRNGQAYPSTTEGRYIRLHGVAQEVRVQAGELVQMLTLDPATRTYTAQHLGQVRSR
jgi:hypothetical protein